MSGRRGHRLLLSMVALFGCVSATSCASFEPIPFTQELIDQHRLTDTDVRNLQYFVDNPIVLRREVRDANREVVRGRLVTREGRLVDEVMVEPLTPGVSLEAEIGVLEVSFERPTFLYFAPGRSGSMLTGQYCLATTVSHVSRDEVRIRFDGQLYDASEGYRTACLLVDARELNELERRRRILKGERIGGG